MEYILFFDQIVFTHAEVPFEFAGKGVGSLLAKQVLEYARVNHKGKNDWDNKNINESTA